MKNCIELYLKEMLRNNNVEVTHLSKERIDFENYFYLASCNIKNSPAFEASIYYTNEPSWIMYYQIFKFIFNSINKVKYTDTIKQTFSKDLNFDKIKTSVALIFKAFLVAPDSNNYNYDLLIGFLTQYIETLNLTDQQRFVQIWEDSTSKYNLITTTIEQGFRNLDMLREFIDIVKNEGVFDDILRIAANESYIHFKLWDFSINDDLEQKFYLKYFIPYAWDDITYFVLLDFKKI